MGAVPSTSRTSRRPPTTLLLPQPPTSPIAALAVANDLFDAAGVPFEAAKPLVEAIVANAFDLGPEAALTGPVARGDGETVAAQLAAVAAHRPEWEQAFRWFVSATADVAGTTDQLGDLT